jgi:hypothetical protein
MTLLLSSAVQSNGRILERLTWGSIPWAGAAKLAAGSNTICPDLFAALRIEIIELVRERGVDNLLIS